MSKHIYEHVQGHITGAFRPRVLPTGGHTSFDPLSLFAAGEQGGWYDPSDLSTMFQDTAGATPVTATGQSVARINDKSGNGNHATQSTAGNRPTLQQDANGKYYLQFTTDDWLETANVNLTATDKASVFIGMQLDSVTGFQGFYDINAGAGGGSSSYASGATFIHAVAGAAGNDILSFADVLLASTPYIFTHRCDLSQAVPADGTMARLNAYPIVGAVSASTSTPGNFANGKFRIGRALVTYLTGRVYQVVWRGAETADVDEIEEFIRDTIVSGVAPASTANAIGDSTIAAYLAQNDVLFYIDSAYTENNNAVPGHSIANQLTAWKSSATRGDPEWIVIQVGLNDLNPAVAASISIAALQSLVDIVQSMNIRPARVLVSQMTPCRARLITAYGAVNGPIAYQKWLDMNDAIAGNGATPITGVDGRVTAHVALLNDGAGNLAAAYDTGDGIHENNAGRQIIAAAWSAAIGALGTV